jgi:hypothetical protein
MQEEVANNPQTKETVDILIKKINPDWFY